MNMKKTLGLVFAFLLATVFVQSAFADVRVSAIIGDNMVLQQGTKIRIWGWANPNEKVSVVLPTKKQMRSPMRVATGRRSLGQSKQVDLRVNDHRKQHTDN